MRKAGLPAFVLLLLPVLAAAQIKTFAVPEGALDDSDWSIENGQLGPSTGTPEGSFSSPESIRFGEEMRRRALDQLCKSLEIPVDAGYGIDGIGAVRGKLHRRIRTLPNVPGERLALVDEMRVNLDLGHTFQIGTVENVSFGISVYSRLEGGSFIVRPLETNKSCKELKQLVKVWKFKTVAPPSPERLGNMQVGELWKLPMQLTIGHSESAGMPVTPYGGVTLSFGVSQTGSANMSVYRLSEGETRFRFRVDHVKIRSQNGSVNASYPASQIFSPLGEDLIRKTISNEIAKQLQHYLNASFGLFRSSSDGQQVLMEFVIDPRKPEDLEALSQALKGDLRGLVTMAYKLVTLQATDSKARADFAAVNLKNEAYFGKSGNPGLNVYHDKSKGFNLQLPFFLAMAGAKSTREDQFINLSDTGGQFTIYKEEKTRNNGGIEIPLKGQLFKHNQLRSAQAYVYETKDGQVSAPQAVYIFQDGFLRRNSGSVREDVQEATRIVELAGAKGGAVNPKLRLPLDGMIPPPPPADPHSDGPPPSGPQYHDGSLNFTLVLTEKAVASILSATAELIALCYRNTLSHDDRALFDVALATARFDADGTMRYDRKAARQAFSSDGGDEGWLNRMTRVVGDIIRDVAAVRNAGTPQAQAQALTQVLAGKGESGLAYQDILQVLIQLVDPLDISADISLNIRKGNKKKKGEDVFAHMTLKNRPENLMLREAGNAKRRFARPSDLVD
jgi:hypothetical protein